MWKQLVPSEDVGYKVDESGLLWRFCCRVPARVSQIVQLPPHNSPLVGRRWQLIFWVPRVTAQLCLTLAWTYLLRWNYSINHMHFRQLFEYFVQTLWCWCVKPTWLVTPALRLNSPERSASCRMHISHHRLHCLLLLYGCTERRICISSSLYLVEEACVHVIKCASVGKFCSHIEFVSLHLFPISKATYAHGS